MRRTGHEADPAQMDPLQYLAEVNGDCSASDRLEHYQVLRPSLLRLQAENPPAFDVAVREITRRLQIKGQTILEDLGGMTPPRARKDARELLEALTDVQRLHPAQAWANGALYYGCPVHLALVFVVSGRQLLTDDELPSGIAVARAGFNLCRFSREGILAYLGGATVLGYGLLHDLQAFFRRFVVFRDARLLLLLALWTLATYTYRLYQFFPYLIVRSASKRCGKSRLLEVLSALGFNASEVLTQPTEAVLFRLPLQNGGTQIFDEVDKLGQGDEAYQSLLAVLNMGFARHGTVARTEKVGDGFTVKSYPCYVPRALAGIKGLPDTLEDRSIMVMMLRKMGGERVKKFSAWRLAAELQHLRDQCYMWSLLHASDIDELYQDAEAFPELVPLDDRAQDIWAPLCTLARLIDVEAEEAGETVDCAETLGALAQDLCQVRDDADTTTVKLLDALLDILKERGTDDTAIEPTALMTMVQGNGFAWVKSTKTLANLMQPLGFVATSTRMPGKRGRAYHLSRSTLDDLQRRYRPRDAVDHA
jgi:hypothetical protein